MTDKHFCAGRVWSPGAMISSACMNNGKHEHDGKWWCRMHHPPTVQARREESRRKWSEKFRVQQDGWVRSEALKKKQAAALSAIEQIAAGHNDPRALAQEVLAMEPK